MQLSTGAAYASAFAQLDAHERRREQDIPTVSTLLGAAEHTALDTAYAWSSARSLPVVGASLDAAESVRRWLVAALKGEEPLLLLARPVARANGKPVPEILNRLRDDALREMPKDYIEALGFDSPTKAIMRALQTGPNVDAISRSLIANARDLRIEPLRLLAATMTLLGRDRGPVLIFTQAGCETTARQIEYAAAFAEAAPGLRVLLTSNRDAFEAEPLQADRHAPDLIRESIVWLSGALATGDPNVAALVDDARRLRDAVPQQPDAARSAAERALFAALQRHETTSGHFELNGKIDALFGNRAAEIDLLARAYRVAIEVDGYHHFRDQSNYRRDRRKDVLMQSEGYFVVRVLADDVIDRLDDVISTIVAVVANRPERT